MATAAEAKLKLQIEAETRQAISALGAFASGIHDVTQAASVAGAAFAAWQITQCVARATGEMYELGAESLRADAALNALTDGRADAYVDAVGRATLGTVADMQAAQITSRVLAFDLADTEQEAAQFVRTATILGGTFQNLSAEDAAEQFALLMTNMSYRRLDSFGLSSSGVRRRVAELRAETAGLTQEEAFHIAVMEQAIPRATELAGSLSDAGSEADRLRANLQNMRAEMAEDIATGFRPALAAINDLIEAQQALNRTPQIQRWAWADPALGAEMEDAFGDAFADRSALHGLAETEQATADLAATLTDDLAGALGIVSVADRQRQDQLVRVIAATRQRTMTTDQAGVALAELGATEEEVADAVQIYEERVRSAERETQNLYRAQTAFVGIAEEVAGELDYVGETAMRYPADLANAYGALREGLTSTRNELGEARAHLTAYGDGTGALRERIADLETQEQFHLDRLREVEDQMAATGEAYTMTALSAEDYAHVGEAILDYYRAVGRETELAGQALIDHQLQYGIITEAQAEMQGALLTLRDAQQAYGLSLEDETALLEGIYTGRIRGAEAVEREVAALRERESVAAARQEVDALGYAAYLDFGDYEAMVDAAMADQAAAAPEGVGIDAAGEAFDAQAEDAALLQDAGTLAYDAIGTAADTALPSLENVAQETAGTLSTLRNIGPTSASAFAAMSAAAARMVREGSGWAAFATSVHHTWQNLLRIEALANSMHYDGGGGGGGPRGGGPVAEGGPVTANTAYLVGEEGPELFIPHSSGFIVPHASATPTGLGNQGMLDPTTVNVFNMMPGMDRARAGGSAAPEPAIRRRDSETRPSPPVFAPTIVVMDDADVARAFDRFERVAEDRGYVSLGVREE